MPLPTARGFAQDVIISNPGMPPVAGRMDIWRNDVGLVTKEGTVEASWTGLAPPGTDLQPWADVVDDTGRVFWVNGEAELRRSLLSGLADHVEVRLHNVVRRRVLVDVLRDSDTADTNDLGDQVETGSGPVATNVPVSIVELEVDGAPADNDDRTVHTLVGWAAADADIRQGDRLRVVGGGPTYGVDHVTQPIETALRELRLDLTRTT